MENNKGILDCFSVAATWNSFCRNLYINNNHHNLSISIVAMVCGLVSGFRSVSSPIIKKTIVLSFAVDSEGNRNYLRIINDLKASLQKLHLLKNIRIFVGASDLIRDNSQAVRYRERNRVDLVVWGKSFYGNLESKKILKFEINHTCVISPNLNEKMQMFLTDLTVILQQRTWTVSELNELANVKVVAEDLLETCLFIIGIYYLDEGQLENASRILESILPVLDYRVRSSNDKIRILQAGRVRAILTDIYFLQANLAHLENDQPKAISLLTRILPLVPNKVPVLMTLARSYYLLGDTFNAQKCTKELRMMDKKHPAVFLNNAFFGIVQKNYERVRFWYDEVLKLSAIRDVDVFSVVTFLDEEYKKNPSEPASLYALGIVNGYVDPKMRRKELSRFMRSTKNRSEYEVLRRRAQELLK